MSIPSGTLSSAPSSSPWSVGFSAHSSAQRGRSGCASASSSDRDGMKQAKGRVDRVNPSRAGENLRHHQPGGCRSRDRRRRRRARFQSLPGLETPCAARGLIAWLTALGAGALRVAVMVNPSIEEVRRGAGVFRCRSNCTGRRLPHFARRRGGPACLESLPPRGHLDAAGACELSRPTRSSSIPSFPGRLAAPGQSHRFAGRRPLRRAR